MAAILAASILGIFFAATTGIFNNSPAPAASTNPISGASQPATNPGLVLTGNEDNNKITKATKIPNPNEITPYKTLIDISNPPKFLETNNNVITNIQISKIKDDNIEIKANHININPERNIIIRPKLICFFDESKNEIPREQWYCKYNGNSPAEVKYGRVHCAYCQWPADFCYYAYDNKLWEEYWKEKLGKKTIKTGMVGSTTKGYEEIIPTLKPGEKYNIIVPCEMPLNTKYIQIL